MSDTPRRLPAWIDFTLWAVGGLVASGLLLGILAIAGGGPERLPRRAVAGTVAVFAFVVPLLFACAGSLADLARLSAGLGGVTVAALLYCAALDPQAVAGALAAMVYVASWSALAFGLSAAVGRAFGGAAAGRIITVLLLVAAATTTFTTGSLLTGLESAPGLRQSIVRVTVGGNPFLMANRALSVGSSGGGNYSPKQGRILYDMWIGTDFPFSYPSWWRLALRWIILGAGLWLAAEELPRRLSGAGGEYLAEGR